MSTLFPPHFPTPFAASDPFFQRHGRNTFRIDFHMRGVRGQDHKIGRIVVLLVAVDMMHYLSGQKRSSKFLRRHDPMDTLVPLFQITRRTRRLMSAPAAVRTVLTRTLSEISGAYIERFLTLNTDIGGAFSPVDCVACRRAPRPLGGLAADWTRFIFHAVIVPHTAGITHRWFSPHCLAARQESLFDQEGVS